MGAGVEAQRLRFIHGAWAGRRLPSTAENREPIHIEGAVAVMSSSSWAVPGRLAGFKLPLTWANT